MSASLEQLLSKETMQRYVITTAQANAPVNSKLLDSFIHYCDRNDAELIVLPTSGITINDTDYSPKITPYLLFDKEYRLNKNVRILDAMIRPQVINPLGGVDHFARNNESSLIMPGTKQTLKYIPDMQDTIPRALMTTGAITHPNYNTKFRQGNIAVQDHEYGAVVLEVEDDKHFHHRFISAFKNGKFSDIPGVYDGASFKKHKSVDAFVVGDLHPFHTDPVHEAQTFDQLQYFKPKKVFLHDAFNGVSISHHYKGRNADKYKAHTDFTGDLGEELQVTRAAILKYANALPRGSQLYLVKSNHDEHLERYLQEGRFVNDGKNSLVGSQLYTELLSGKDPLDVGLNLYGKLPSNVHFLQRDSDLRVRGYQLAMHGDIGSNGTRGSITSMERAFGKSITGHSHTVVKQRNALSVGTSTRLRIGYNKGPSSWVQANIAIYDTGHPQIFNTINGRWRG
jgi:hypothetical protein